MTATDRIEKQIVLRAPRARVWRAIADAREFGAWFRVALTGDFVAGATVTGHILEPGYEHLRMEVVVERVEPEERLSFRWHPAAVDPAIDYSGEATTLVEFVLADAPEGTRLTVTESGFDALPPERRANAWRMNEGGWGIQLGRIGEYVAAQ